MNFGYLISVSTSSVDYLKMAYALALSIKNTQKPGYDQVCLMIDDTSKLENLKSKWVFDHVIEHSGYTGWDSRSWMDKYSPFDSTVCLDADMLFLRDTSHWVDYLIENCELYVANSAYTFRGEKITDDFYRKVFTKNKLPNLYSMYTFFKKDSKLADDFFTLGRYILKNPTEFSNIYLEEFRPKVIGTDEAFAVSAKILDIQNEMAYPLSFPRIVHLKPMVQNWPWPAEKVTDHAGFYFSPNGKLKIGNYHQSDLIHYVEKDLITDEIVSLIEEIAWHKNL